MDINMQNKHPSIKAIFIKRMGYSAVIQFLVFGFILILSKDYFYHKRIDILSRNMVISDPFTISEIGRHHLLGNKDALDLELYNLEIERKLDSIKFIPFSGDKINFNLGTCESVSNDDFKICKTNNERYSGVTT